MLEAIGTLATVLAVMGVRHNNNRRRVCFLFWIVSNSLGLAIHLAVGPWALVVRDAIFLALAVQGWVKWGRAAEGKP
jgi:nicotinamide riboside transporter PnuC